MVATSGIYEFNYVVLLCAIRMQILLVSVQAHNYCDNAVYNDYVLLFLAKTMVALVNYCNSPIFIRQQRRGNSDRV